MTAVDISTVALGRGAERAAAAGVDGRIDWQHQQLGQSVPDGAFDLVSAQLFQSPVELDRVAILRAGAAALVPGGTLLIVSHAAAPTWSQHGHDHHFPPPAEEWEALAPDPEDWEVVRCETAERPATGPDGQEGTLSDGIVQVRRRSG